MRELKGDWRDLLHGFMIALDLRKMFLALCGIVSTLALAVLPTLYVGNALNWEYVHRPENLAPHEIWKSLCQSWHVIYSGQGLVNGPNPMIYIPYSIGFLTVLIIIWSFFGGAIARIAAYEIAKDGERIETDRALRFSGRKFWALFWAPLICAIGFGLFFACNFIGGVVGGLLDYVWIGGPLVALALPLAILSGFIMALILVGTAAGFPLFVPAVAAEGTDAFDSVSRGFSYVYSKPWHYAGYQIVASAYGYVCIGFVALFTILMCHLALWAGNAGFFGKAEAAPAPASEKKAPAKTAARATGRRIFSYRSHRLNKATPEPDFGDVVNAAWIQVLSDDHQEMAHYRWTALGILRQPHLYGRTMTLANEIVDPDYMGCGFRNLRTPKFEISCGIMLFWLLLAIGMAAGYAVSYVISQQTMIYFILRKKVDGIEMNEVFEETEEEAPAPAAAPAPSTEAKPAEEKKT